MRLVDQPTLHQKTWGREEWLCNNELYCGKILTVFKDLFCSLHAHIKKTEDFYILKGLIKFEWSNGRIENGTVVRDGPIQCEYLSEGRCVHVPPLLLHRFTGIDPISKIIETSTQHFEDDSYRVEPSYQPKGG